MAKKKSKKKRQGQGGGRKEERLKINMDWESAAKLLVTKKPVKSANKEPKPDDNAR